MSLEQQQSPDKKRASEEKEKQVQRVVHPETSEVVSAEERDEEIKKRLEDPTWRHDLR